ncbi:Uncharacterised protein [uncultured archaeon]|nr:Uncharacterised protein [uncultured archaeon]
MKLKAIIIAVIILLGLAFTTNAGPNSPSEQPNNTFLDSAIQHNNNTVNGDDLADDIEPYEGSIGPDNALYGLKLAFENLDESFTFNESEKLGKQIAHARLRIAEAKAELNRNNNGAAEKAFERYREKADEAEVSVSRFSVNDSGLPNAEKMIKKHQNILERLRESHPNNTGLARAYNNSLKLEERFKQRLEQKDEERIKEAGRVKERVEVNAEVFGNATKVEVDAEFISNSTEKDAIAQEILGKLNVGRETINNSLKLEGENTVTTPAPPGEEKLEAKAEVEGNISRIEIKYKFSLNATDRDGIIQGINQKLSSLTINDLLKAFEIKINGDARKEVKEVRQDDKNEEKHVQENNRTKDKQTKKIEEWKDKGKDR